MKAAILIESSETKVRLSLSGAMNQGNVIVRFLQIQLLFLRGHIISSQAVAAVVAGHLLCQAVVNPPCCVSLLSGRFLVLVANQPAVNQWFVRIEL